MTVLEMTLTRLFSVRKMTLLASARKNLNGAHAFIQQTDDAHGSEYTCPTDNRRPQVSGTDFLMSYSSHYTELDGNVD